MNLWKPWVAIEQNTLPENISPDVLVFVKFADGGKSSRAIRAEDWSWGCHEGDTIIAYKIAEEQP